MEFGGRFDVGDVLFVKVREPVFDGWTHRHRFADVLVLVLEESDALVDDGALLELRTLLARGVLWELGFGTLEDVSASVDGAESESTEGSGEGLNRLIRVEGYFCHSRSAIGVHWFIPLR